MESAAVLRSFHYSVGTVSHLRSLLEMPSMVPVHNVTWPNASKFSIRGLTFGAKLVSSATNREGMLASCVKTSEAALTANCDDSRSHGSVEKNYPPSATFPNGFEELITNVCDETQVAELKLKVGEFEMHLKRNIGVSKAPLPVVSLATPPPVPSKPMIESTPATPPPKSSTEKISPFTNMAVEKSAKLKALEASGARGYVLVSSPTVGSFRRGRTLKGKKQPPICKEGGVIKAGQTIGFLDQFGTELPVKSDVAGEVVKILFNDGEAVGYGDPLIAVLPSFNLQ